MKYIEVDGVEGLVEVPDDITDEQILDVGEKLTQGRVQSAAGAMMRQGGSMWGKAAQGLSRIAQVLGNSGLSIGPGGAVFSNPDAAMAGARMTGAEKQKQLEEDPTYQFGENLAAGAEEAFPTNPLYADKLETAVASGLGSVIALAPSALAGPAAPMVAGGGYGMSAGESSAEEAQAILDSRIQAALEQGDINTAAKLEQDKFSIETAAFLATAPIGAATEGALGVAGRMAGMARGKGGALGGLTDKVVGSMAKSQTVKRGVEGMVSESLQEGLEQVGGNLVAKGLYDPERDITEGLGMSMLAGGIVGGGVGAGAGALADRSRNAVAPTEPEVTIAPESANEVQAMLDALEAANKVTKDNFTDAEAITPEMEVPVDVTPPPVEAPVDVTPPPPPVEEQAELQAELDAQVSAGTTEAPPTPESPEQVEAQLEATLDPDSTKAVTLVTPGEELPPIPEGLEVGEPTEAGIPIFNPEKITPELVTEAGQGDVYDPGVLGLGSEVAQSDTAVTTSTPEGTPVLEELVTPETVTAAIQAQQAAVPGGVTEVKPAAQVVAKRRKNAAKIPISSAQQASTKPAPEAPTQGQTTPTPPGSAPSPDAGKQGVGVQSTIKGGEITNEEEKGKQQGQVPVVPTPAQQLDSERNRGPVTDEAERGELTTEEFVELNELRITREQRGGKLGALNTERVSELEAKQKGKLDEFKSEMSAASKAQQAVETWAKHHEDVIRPAREAAKRAEQFANEMAQDARRTKPETKAKERITKKAFLSKYGVKSMDEANEIYKARIKEWNSKLAELETANAKGVELEKAKELANKVWSKEANKRRASEEAKSSESIGERALNVLDAIEKKIDSNTYSDPLLLTVFAKLAIKLARQLIKGGMAINQAIRQAVADARKQMPDATDDDAAVADKIEREIQSEDAKAGTGELLTPAPGEKVQESKGRFTGLVSKDTDKEWQQQAEEWMSQFGDDLETAYQKTISPVTPVDAALRQYVLTELLARTDAAIKTKNPVTQMAMLKLQAAIADSLKDSGKQEFGTVGAARALALKRIEWLMPVLMFRGLVKDAQSRLPFPDITSDKVRDWLKRAGSKAVSEVRKAMKDADNVVARELKREVKDLGVNWGDIIRSSEAVQGDFRRALYRTVLEHPKLTGITPKAVTEIVNLLANEWERQRLRIFRQEFAKEVKLPNVSEKTMNRLEEAIPAIVIQANVGLLDNEAFRNAVAPKFGVEQFDSKTADLVYKLAQEAQGMKGVNRTKLLNRITDTIQRAGGVSKSDVFRDYWFAAMLSGVRTMVDNGLSILVGALTTSLATMHALAKTPGAAPLMTRAYGAGLAEAASDFVPILKGERWRTHNVDIDRPASALDAMLASPNPLKKAIGSAAYVSRLISALDHMNALSTRQAMMVWAAMRADPATAKAMLEVSPEQREAAREQAIQEGTEKSLLRKRTREILEERVPVETILTATNLGLLASFQNDPYGVAGHFYQFIKRLDKLPGFGKFTRLVSGTAFARYALNYTNDILNYVSPIGIMRWYASSPGMQDKEHSLKITEEERQLIMMKSVMGSLVAAAAAAVFLGDDDDDEKKRAIDITGSFKSLDPEKRNQLLSEGRQPYSIRFGDTYVSYRQLPVAGVLGTVGEMRDKQLFDKEAWKAQNPASTVANAAIAGMFIVRDSSSLTGLMDLLGFASAYKYDTEAMVDKSIPRFVAKLLGGMIPNIAKEIDAWQDPSIYKATHGWEYFLQQVPWGRRELEPGPQVNVLGEKIAVERLPWSRWVRERSKDPVWDTMGKLADKGIFMPMPGKFTVQTDDGTRREPTKKEMYDYQKAVGEAYKDWIKDDGRDLLDMEPAEAKRLIDRTTTRLRKQARMELGL